MKYLYPCNTTILTGKSLHHAFKLEIRKKKILETDLYESVLLMSHLVTKPTEWHVRPAKTQISLGIRPV